MYNLVVFKDTKLNNFDKHTIEEIAKKCFCLGKENPKSPFDKVISICEILAFDKAIEKCSIEKEIAEISDMIKECMEEDD